CGAAQSGAGEPDQGTGEDDERLGAEHHPGQEAIDSRRHGGVLTREMLAGDPQSSPPASERIPGTDRWAEPSRDTAAPSRRGGQSKENQRRAASVPSTAQITSTASAGQETAPSTTALRRAEPR